MAIGTVRLDSGHTVAPDLWVSFDTTEGIPTGDCRMEMAVALTSEQVDALAAAFTRMADSVAEWANQVVSSLSAWFEHVQTEAWFQALTQAAQSATETLPSRPLSARDRERELLDHHRRSHRRTNRWGPPPGRR